MLVLLQFFVLMILIVVYGVPDHVITSVMDMHANVQNDWLNSYLLSSKSNQAS